jgi:hypothetical protein
MVHARQRGARSYSTWRVYIDHCEVGRCCKQASQRLGRLTSPYLVGYMWRHCDGESLVILLLPHLTPQPLCPKSSDNSAHVKQQSNGRHYTWRDCRFDFSLTGAWLLSQQPAKCIVTDEAPKLSSRDLFGCCRVRAMQHYRSGERWEWSNGGMTERRKTKGLRRQKSTLFK